MKRRRTNYNIRYIVLAVLLVIVLITQMVPAMGEFYARSLYPYISSYFSFFSQLVPFALGDLFIFLSIVGVIAYPIYARVRKKRSWKKILLDDGEYLLWVYVWFYLAWGLNYSQKSFYERTEISYVEYNDELFLSFFDEYVEQLNQAYIPIKEVDENRLWWEVVSGYEEISDSLAVHRPPKLPLRPKTMLFTPLASKAGITGSMGPFFCEFTLNGDLLPSNYPATYAHEFSHLLGITNEAEANFYAYQVCTRSSMQEIRFSGYFSILPYVLNDAYELFSEEEYEALLAHIRPEVIELAEANRAYWVGKYSPLIGKVQNAIYDFYLKQNKVESGRKSYSEVIGLLISYRAWKK